MKTTSIFLPLMFLFHLAFSQDIIITDLQIPSSAKRYSEIQAEITFKNIGIADVQAFNVCNIYLSNNSEYIRSVTENFYIGFTNFSELSSGASISLSCDLSHFEMPAGTYYLFAVADYRSEIEEANEDNNIWESTMNIESTGIDFTFSQLSIDKSTVASFDMIRPTFEIIDAGSTNSSGGLYTSFYLSTDEVLDASDLKIDYFWNSIGGQNSVSNNTWDYLQVPETSPGSYYILGHADENYNGESSFEEANELNNVETSGTIQIIDPSIDLEIVNASMVSVQYDMLEVHSIIVKNHGSTGVIDYEMNVFLSEDDNLDPNDTKLTFRPEKYDSDSWHIPGSSQKEIAYMYMVHNSQEYLPSGTFQILLEINPDKSIPETNFSNNIYNAGIVIIDEYSLNLDLDTVYVLDPQESQTNLSIAMEIRNSNDNNVNVEQMFNVYLRDKDQNIFGYDFKFEIFNVFSNASETIDWSLSLDKPLEAGEYELSITCAEPEASECILEDTQVNFSILPTNHEISIEFDIEGDYPNPSGELFLYILDENMNLEIFSSNDIDDVNSSQFKAPNGEYTLLFIPDPSSDSYLTTYFNESSVYNEKDIFEVSKDTVISFNLIKKPEEFLTLEYDTAFITSNVTEIRDEFSMEVVLKNANEKAVDNEHKFSIIIRDEGRKIILDESRFGHLVVGAGASENISFIFPLNKNLNIGTYEVSITCGFNESEICLLDEYKFSFEVMPRQFNLDINLETSSSYFPEQGQLIIYNVENNIIPVDTIPYDGAMSYSTEVLEGDYTLSFDPMDDQYFIHTFFNQQMLKANYNHIIISQDTSVNFQLLNTPSLSYQKVYLNKNPEENDTKLSIDAIIMNENLVDISFEQPFHLLVSDQNSQTISDTIITQTFHISSNSCDTIIFNLKLPKKLSPGTYSTTISCGNDNMDFCIVDIYEFDFYVSPIFYSIDGFLESILSAQPINRGTVELYSVDQKTDPTLVQDYIVDGSSSFNFNVTEGDYFLYFIPSLQDENLIPTVYELSFTFSDEAIFYVNQNTFLIFSVWELPEYIPTGQSSIYGTISANQDDSRISGTGIKNALILLVDNDGKIIQKTFTDENGYYEFTGLGPGEYSLIVKRDIKEYLHTEEISINLGTSDVIVDLEIQNNTENIVKIAKVLSLTSDLSNEKHIEIYPNPGDDYIVIESASPINQISIYSIFGEKVLDNSEGYLNKINLGIKHISSGSYIIEITDNKYQTERFRFVKK